MEWPALGEKSMGETRLRFLSYKGKACICLFWGGGGGFQGKHPNPFACHMGEPIGGLCSKGLG